MHPTYLLIHALVARIPRGRVATYGQIAALAGMPNGSRQVGYALHALPDGSTVPWHRVVNAQGAISSRSDPPFETIQRRLLEREGIRFDAGGRLDLERHRWRPHGGAPVQRRPTSAAARRARGGTRPHR